MDREAVIRMAREAGWSGIYTQWREPDGSPDWTPVKESLTVPVTIEQIERFAVLAFAAGAAAEREACAKVCEGLGVHPALNVFNGGPEWYKHGKDCAAAIRARGNT